MKFNCIKVGLVIFAASALLVFQNCGNSSSFEPIASTEGDITDPVYAKHAKCSYDGKEYFNTQTIETFVESSVGYDQECRKQTHVCDDGTWTGAIGFKDCGKGVPRDCLLGVDTIKHNTSVTRFESANLIYPEKCRSQERRCVDSALSGSYTVKDCTDPEPPRATGRFVCKQRDGAPYKVEDLYEKWSDGSERFKEKCSDWHITRQNASWNCGRITDGIYGQLTTIASQPSCCPDGNTVVNGLCMPIATRGQACYGPLNCADGLECKTDYTSDSTPFDRTCQ